jgi:acetoin utilization deacetylase AcuC-like enzyme
MSPGSGEAALRAAGAVCAAVDAVAKGDASNAFCAVRPPGHHAERGKAMGFCLFNNVAVAAAHARAQGLARVAIVDYDVHHGNGTQWAFYGDASVLFISSHQYPYYPGTGAAGDTGTGAGKGFTVNLPLDAGATDADYELVYTRVALPVLRQFKPDLILLSAGFDAHHRDPLAGMRLTTEQFGRLTAHIAAVADEACGGRVVALTEGGYDLHALAASLDIAMRVLAGESALDDFPQPAAAAPRAESCLAAVLPEVNAFWTV